MSLEIWPEDICCDLKAGILSKFMFVDIRMLLRGCAFFRVQSLMPSIKESVF